VKMEAMQPASSHKARAARHILRRAIADGKLTPGGPVRLLEKSGGNLGVGLAYEASRYGISVDLVIGLSFSRTKRALCEQYGARVVHEDWLRDGMTPKEVIAQLIDEAPERFFFSDQFANEANLQAHLTETGPELAEQIAQVLEPGQELILVKGAGTGASFQGIATRLRERFEGVSCQLVMPQGCDLVTDTFSEHPLEGFAVGVKPPFLDLGLVDVTHYVSASDAAAGQAAMARDLGFFPGITSGANYATAKRIAAENPKALVATLAYDSGESYLGSALLRDAEAASRAQDKVLQDA
jgi:cysteine synthase